MRLENSSTTPTPLPLHSVGVPDMKYQDIKPDVFASQVNEQLLMEAIKATNLFSRCLQTYPIHPSNLDFEYKQPDTPKKQIVINFKPLTDLLGVDQLKIYLKFKVSTTPTIELPSQKDFSGNLLESVVKTLSTEIQKWMDEEDLSFFNELERTWNLMDHLSPGAYSYSGEDWKALVSLMRMKQTDMIIVGNETEVPKFVPGDIIKTHLITDNTAYFLPEQCNFCDSWELQGIETYINTRDKLCYCKQFRGFYVRPHENIIKVALPRW